MASPMNQFSRTVAREVFRAFPELKRFESVAEDDGEVTLYVEVDAPSGNAKQPLRVYTRNDEITVSFDAYHAHYFEFDSGDGDDAHTLLSQILSDEYAVVSYWRDEQWCGSTVLDKQNLPLDNAEYPYANRIEFRSWRGGLDQNVICTPRG